MELFLIIAALGVAFVALSIYNWRHAGADLATINESEECAEFHEDMREMRAEWDEARAEHSHEVNRGSW